MNETRSVLRLPTNLQVGLWLSARITCFGAACIASPAIVLISDSESSSHADRGSAAKRAWQAISRALGISADTRILICFATRLHEDYTNRVSVSTSAAVSITAALDEPDGSQERHAGGGRPVP